jgi:hypothetical protein
MLDSMFSIQSKIKTWTASFAWSMWFDKLERASCMYAACKLEHGMRKAVLFMPNPQHCLRCLTAAAGKAQLQELTYVRADV